MPAQLGKSLRWLQRGLLLSFLPEANLSLSRKTASVYLRSVSIPEALNVLLIGALLALLPTVTTAATDLPLKLSLSQVLAQTVTLPSTSLDQVWYPGHE